MGHLTSLHFAKIDDLVSRTQGGGGEGGGPSMFSFHHQMSCKKSAVCSLFRRAYSMIIEKDRFAKKRYNNTSVEREWISVTIALLVKSFK